MIEQNDKKKLAIALLLFAFLVFLGFNSFLKAIDKGDIWRMVLSGIPTIAFSVFIVMILIKLYKLNKNK